MRAMRIIVMFDLPATTPVEKRAYIDFRRFLVEDGYRMEQFSVYSKVAMGGASAEAARLRLRLNRPPFGSVTVFEMTEKQYASREILVDSREASRHDIGTQLTLEF